VANVLALCAAFLFALAATLQQKGALGMGESLRSPASFVRLARQTWWLLGSLALLSGYVCQAVALDHGKLAVIQPLLVTTIRLRAAPRVLPHRPGRQPAGDRRGRVRRDRARGVCRRR
jgi:hypothetical protein